MEGEDGRVKHMTMGGAVATLALVAGCGSGDAETTTDKYTQTWDKTYSATTCEEWSADMTEAQRWAAAADMLTGARNKGDGGTGLPTDALVDDFRDDVDGACEVAPTLSLAEAGAGTYLTERSRYAP